MLKLFGIILLLGVEDSTIVVEKNDTIPPSLVFKQETTDPKLLYKYKHEQGFFCDFEDKINENRKINLNIGVGDQ